MLNITAVAIWSNIEFNAKVMSYLCSPHSVKDLALKPEQMCS